MENAYTKNIAPWKNYVNENLHAEKWIATSYGAGTGFLAEKGYFEQQFSGKIHKISKIIFQNPIKSLLLFR